MKNSGFIQQTKKGKGRVLRSVFFILFFLLCLFLLRLYVVESLHISTDAMETTLHKGDFVLVNKLSDAPERRDIVLFTSPLRRDSLTSPMLISRCVGIPGDTIQVNAGSFLVNGEEYPNSPHALNTYLIAPEGEKLFLELIKKLQIPLRDKKTVQSGISLTLTSFEEYQLREELPDAMDSCFALQPMAPYTLVVPQKDRAYRLDAASLIACKEAIRTELGTKAVFREGKLFVDGKETTFFFFSQDHYWMLSDHADEAVDSRHLGFIPRDHVVGNVLFCWFSREKQRCLKPVY